jgi:hypothetical protein
MQKAVSLKLFTMLPSRFTINRASEHRHESIDMQLELMMQFGSWNLKRKPTKAVKGMQS